MRKSVCIAPFKPADRVLLSCPSNLGAVNSVAIPPAYYQHGMNAAFLYGGLDVSIKCSDNYESLVDSSDCVLLTIPDKPVRSFARAIEDYAKSTGKEIYRCTTDNDNQSRLVLGSNSVASDGLDWISERYSELRTPTIHVVSVCGSLDTFEVLPKLGQWLFVRQKNAAMISESPYCGLYGVNRFNLSRADEEAILELNSIAAKLEYIYHPFTIIVEHAKPFTSYSDSVHYDFGLSSYGAIHAIPPDIVLCCIPLNLADPSVLESCAAMLAAATGTDKISYLIGNQITDSSDEIELQRLAIHYERETVAVEVANRLRSFGAQAFCIYNEQELDLLGNWLLEGIGNSEWRIL